MTGNENAPAPDGRPGEGKSKHPPISLQHNDSVVKNATTSSKFLNGFRRVQKTLLDSAVNHLTSVSVFKILLLAILEEREPGAAFTISAAGAAERCHIDIRTAERALLGLCKGGWLELVRPGEGRRPNTYRLRGNTGTDAGTSLSSTGSEAGTYTGTDAGARGRSTGAGAGHLNTTRKPSEDGKGDTAGAATIKAAAQHILVKYSDQIKPADVDETQIRAAPVIEALLRDHSESAINRAIGNYSEFCAYSGREPRYRRGAANFFQTDIDHYLSDEWSLPAGFEGMPREPEEAELEEIALAVEVFDSEWMNKLREEYGGPEKGEPANAV